MPLRIAFEALRASPLRTALSALGVIIGVAALVAVLALGDGFENAVRAMAAADGRLQSVSVASRTTDLIAEQRVPRERVARLTVGDADALRAAVRAASAGTSVRLSVTGMGRVEGAWATSATPSGIRVVATTAPDDAATPPRLGAGRLFTDAEARRAAAVAVVSDSLARLLAGGAREAVGATLRLESTAVRVVGVLAPVEGARAQPPLATVPIALAERVLAPATVPQVPGIDIRAGHVEGVPLVKLAAERWLAGRFGAGWRDSASVQSYEREAAQGARGILLFKLFMSAITGISLVVGGIGIMNVLLASVTERTREIGIRRAVGARRRDILRQFLAESVTISLAGSALGTALGMAAAVVGTRVMRQAATVDVRAGFSPSTMMIIVAAAIGVGLVFGTYPALRAARLSPIDALRHE